jgi:hypothetical protein
MAKYKLYGQVYELDNGLSPEQAKAQIDARLAKQRNKTDRTMSRNLRGYNIANTALGGAPDFAVRKLFGDDVLKGMKVATDVYVPESKQNIDKFGTIIAGGTVAAPVKLAKGAMNLSKVNPSSVKSVMADSAILSGLLSSSEGKSPAQVAQDVITGGLTGGVFKYGLDKAGKVLATRKLNKGYKPITPSEAEDAVSAAYSTLDDFISTSKFETSPEVLEKALLKASKDPNLGGVYSTTKLPESFKEITQLAKKFDNIPGQQITQIFKQSPETSSRFEQILKKAVLDEIAKTGDKGAQFTKLYTNADKLFQRKETAKILSNVLDETSGKMTGKAADTNPTTYLEEGVTAVNLTANKAADIRNRIGKFDDELGDVVALKALDKAIKPPTSVKTMQQIGSLSPSGANLGTVGGLSLLTLAAVTGGLPLMAAGLGGAAGAKYAANKTFKRGIGKATQAIIGNAPRQGKLTPKQQNINADLARILGPQINPIRTTDEEPFDITKTPFYTSRNK